jgi:hypothetical protein
MLDRGEAIRSQGRARIQQELWGTLLAHNFVRLERERVAGEAHVVYTRINFLCDLHLSCTSDCGVHRPHRAPSQDTCESSLLRCGASRLPPRRTQGRYPLGVMIKMIGYARQRGPPLNQRAK